MDRLIELLKKAQDGKTQAEFAATLGVTQSMVSKLYAGNRRPGKGVITGLCRLLPEHSVEILSLFFAPEDDPKHVDMTPSVHDRQMAAGGKPA